MTECQVNASARPVAILGAGLNTSLGTTLPAVSAAYRGRIKPFKEHDWLPSGVDGRPLLAAVHGTLPPQATIDERMLRLVHRPINEAIASVRAYGVDPNRLELAVLLALPPPRPGWDETAKMRFLRTWATALPFRIDRSHSAILETGHHGAIALLRQAIAKLEAGAVELCLVGGVDSWIDIQLLDWLDGQRRLKGPACPQGIVPGEGAAFLLLGSWQLAQRLRWPVLGHLLAAGEAVDPTPWHLGGPIRGDGLSTLLQHLLTTGRPIAQSTWADLNGEPWRADEWMVAYLRSAERHGEPLDLRHPADGWGDIGAASGAALVALATHELRRDTYGPSTALVWTASDTRPFRSACLLTRATE